METNYQNSGINKFSNAILNPLETKHPTRNLILVIAASVMTFGVLPLVALGASKLANRGTQHKSNNTDEKLKKIYETIIAKDQAKADKMKDAITNPRATEKQKSYATGFLEDKDHPDRKKAADARTKLNDLERNKPVTYGSINTEKEDLSLTPSKSELVVDDEDTSRMDSLIESFNQLDEVSANKRIDDRIKELGSLIQTPDNAKQVKEKAAELKEEIAVYRFIMNNKKGRDVDPPEGGIGLTKKF